MPRPALRAVVVSFALFAVACRKDDDVKVAPPSTSAASATAASASTVLDSVPAAVLGPRDALWFSREADKDGEVRFLVEEEVPHPTKSASVATYAYDAAGKQLAREVRTIKAEVRPEVAPIVAVAKVVPGAVTYVPVVSAIEFADGKDSWNDPSVAPADRAYAVGAEGGAFAGEYASTEGQAKVTQVGDRVTIAYDGGHARCRASGKTLACTWHEAADYGEAALTRDAEGKLNGTWGVGKSATDGGDWHFVPVKP